MCRLSWPDKYDCLAELSWFCRNDNITPYLHQKKRCTNCNTGMAWWEGVIKSWSEWKDYHIIGNNSYMVFITYACLETITIGCLCMIWGISLACISNVSLCNGESIGLAGQAAGWTGSQLAVYQTFSTNHLSYTKTLVPIYRFRAITSFWWCLPKMVFLPQNKKYLLWAVFQEALNVAPLFKDICLKIFGAWINKKKNC